MVDSEFLVYVADEGICVREFQFVFDGFKLVDPSYWCMSFDVVVHSFCVWVSSKAKIICSLSVYLEVYMFYHGIKGILPFNHRSVLPLMDAVTSPILSLAKKPCVLIAFPGFWVVLSNDPDFRTVLTVLVASVDSLSV